LACLINRAIQLQLLAVALVLSAVFSAEARAQVTCSEIPFDPSNFPAPTTIDNTYLPLIPGMQLTLQGTADRGPGVQPHRVTLTVTDLTKVIDGVRTLVLWDVDTNNGQVVESELAFFAQDDPGNVWNLGEYPEEYDAAGTFIGAPSTWIAGLRDAEGGVHMLAQPQVSQSFYLQGSAPDVEFLDCARVTLMGQTVIVPAATFQNVLVTEETGPLDPAGGSQIKYYAPGVGNVKVEALNDPEGETLELVQRVQLTPDGLAAARQEALKLDAHGYEASDVYGQTPPAELPAPPPQPPAPPPAPQPVATPTPASPMALTLKHARGVVRHALRARLRHSKITRLSCRRVSARRAACRFAAKGKTKRVHGTGVVIRRLDGAARYRLKVRIVKAGCRPRGRGHCVRRTIWSSSGAPS